jgi:hypothetical protein
MPQAMKLNAMLIPNKAGGGIIESSTILIRKCCSQRWPTVRRRLHPVLRRNLSNCKR